MRRMPSSIKSCLSPIGVLALALSAAACTGVMDGKDGGMGPGGPNQNTAGTGGNTPIDPTDMTATMQPIDPGHVEIHRLNTAEYNATVADVLGTKLQPA